MKFSKDDIDYYFTYGLDVKHRSIFLTSDLEDEETSNVIKGLYLLDNQSQEIKPIELRISSYGGDICNMMAIHDATRTIQSPVYTTGIGKVMSAAVLLVACGDKGNRWAGANTSWMVHEPWSDWGEKKMGSVRADLAFTKKLWSGWYQLMEKYTAKDAKFWRRLCQKDGDYFFSTDQACEWGIIDHIWSEKQ